MSERPNSGEIMIKGIQKTNLGPVGDDEELELFKNGIIGGSVSDEFEKAQKFRESLGLEEEE